MHACLPTLKNRKFNFKIRGNRKHKNEVLEIDPNKRNNNHDQYKLCKPSSTPHTEAGIT